MPRRTKYDVIRPLRVSPATPEQLSAIQQAIVEGNYLYDEIIDSATALAIATLVSTAGHAFFSYLIRDWDVYWDWVHRAQNEAAYPYMEVLYEKNPWSFSIKTYDPDMFEQFRMLMARLDDKIRDIPLDNPKKFNTVQKYLAKTVNAEISKIFGTTSPYFIERIFNRGKYGIYQGRFNCEIKVAFLLTALTPILRFVIIDKPLKFVLHKIYNLRFINQLPTNQLTNYDAQDVHKALLKHNQACKKWASRGVQFNRALAIIAVTWACYLYATEYEWLPPSLMIFIFINITDHLRALYNRRLEHIKTLRMQADITEIQLSLNTLCPLLPGYFLIRNGKTLQDCRGVYQSAAHKNVQDTLVNQMIKDIFLKNGLNIIFYNSTQFSFQLRKFSPDEIDAIKTQIEATLNRWVQIKTLNDQFNTLFIGLPVWHSYYMEDGLPTASFSINFPIDNSVIDILNHNFPHLQHTIDGSRITCKGHLASTDKQLTFSKFKNVSFAQNGNIYRKIKLVKPAISIPQNEVAIDIAVSPTEPKKKFEWDSGTYNENSDVNDIQPIKSPFLGKNHFVLFAIPRKYFHNDDAYLKAKAKIEEGRLASNAKGAQGLQFRPSQVRDFTQPAEPWVDAHMRYKTLGELGDLRFFAKREVTKDKKQNLYVFCNVMYDAHKP